MSPSRKTLALFGRRGDQVRALVDARRNRVEVKYREIDRTKASKTWPNTKEGRAEAIAWAETYHEERAKMAAEQKTPAKRVPITVGDLWLRYLESPAYTKDLREKSQINYRGRWKKWEAFIKPDALADDTTLHDIDRFRAACETAGIVLNSVRQCLNVVRTVYNWGQSRELVSVNKLALHRWKQPKDVKPIEPGEYSTEEWEAMLKVFQPWRLMDGSYFASKNWRPWVTLMIMGHHGQRWQAIRHLSLDDIDWEAGTVTWIARYQKQGKDVVQPITWGMYAALIVARFWAERHLVMRPRRRVRVTDGPRRGKWIRDPELQDEPIRSPWVLFAEKKKDRPYSYSSFHFQLMKAERDAVLPDGKKGIAHEEYRAGHALRRMRVGNVLRATGDLLTAMNTVGDRDIKQAKSYDKRMQDRINVGVASIEEER
jgi:integrase